MRGEHFVIKTGLIRYKKEFCILRDIYFKNKFTSQRSHFSNFLYLKAISRNTAQIDENAFPKTFWIFFFFWLIQRRITP